MSWYTLIWAQGVQKIRMHKNSIELKWFKNVGKFWRGAGTLTSWKIYPLTWAKKTDFVVSRTLILEISHNQSQNSSDFAKTSLTVVDSKFLFLTMINSLTAQLFLRPSTAQNIRGLGTGGDLLKHWGPRGSLKTLENPNFRGPMKTLGDPILGTGYNSSLFSQEIRGPLKTLGDPVFGDQGWAAFGDFFKITDSNN